MAQNPATSEPAPGLTPSASTPISTPFQGSFQAVSAVSRSQSASPRKRQIKQPLHIRMNLTETQVDKLTDAFTSSREQSPSRKSRSSMASPSPRPKGARAMPARHRKMSSLTSQGEERAAPVTPVVGELAPSWPTSTKTETLAERRQHSRDEKARVEERTQGSRESLKPHYQQATGLLSPLELRHSVGASDPRQSPSPASPLYRHPSQEPEPLRILPRSTYQPHHAHHEGAMGHREGPGIEIQNLSSHGGTATPRRAKSHADHSRGNVEGLMSPWPRAPAMPSKTEVMASKESPLFSPLNCYFQGPDFPMEKRGGKILIGDNGWLERTGPSHEEIKIAVPKKTGILEGIKRIAKDMSELHHGRRPPLDVQEVSSGSVTVSLDAREQSLLYCELEFHLTNSLNSFIVAQLERGNLVPQKLQKVAEAWQQKGRPRVVAFRYDLESQLELLELHVEAFVFHGRRKNSPLEISGLLQAMKAHARAMSIRTFCQPDSVIAKQLVGAQSLFHLIGADGAQDRALKEIAHFFRVIVDREMKDDRRASKDDAAWMHTLTRSSSREGRHRSPRRWESASGGRKSPSKGRNWAAERIETARAG